MNIEQELKKIFDKQSDTLYEEDIKEIKQNLENKNCNHLIEKCENALAQIETSKLNEFYENLEKRIKQKVIDLGQIEDKLINLEKNLTFPSENRVQYLRNITSMNNFFTENISQISTAMESLENDYLDSIKKMKKTYENREKDSIIDFYLKSYKEKKSRKIEMIKLKNDKERVLFEKTETLKANSEKVAKCEAEYEQTKGKYNQEFMSQQIILDEIQQLNSNTVKYENDINLLETSLIIKARTVNITLYNLVDGRIYKSDIKRKERRIFNIIVGDNDNNLRNMKNDLNAVYKQYEVSQMMKTEYETMCYKAKLYNVDKIYKDFEIFAGMILYNKFLRLKIKKETDLYKSLYHNYQSSIHSYKELEKFVKAYRNTLSIQKEYNLEKAQYECSIAYNTKRINLYDNIINKL